MTSRLVGIALALAVAWCSPSAVSSQTSSTELAKGAYVLSTPLGPTINANNLLLVDAQRVMLVDTLVPDPGLFASLKDAIHGLTGDRPVDTLINTHFHVDHVGLNAFFAMPASEGGDGTGTIIAHWRAGEFIARTHCLVVPPGASQPPFPDAAQPTREVYRRMVLPLEGGRVTLQAVANAHSAADLVVYARVRGTDIAFLGDLFFTANTYPIIDIAAGGSVEGMIRALDEVLLRVDRKTKVVPSHGEVSDREGLIAFRQMLATTRDRMRSLIASGATEDEAVVDPIFADLDAVWNNPFMPGPLFRSVVYKDLVGWEPACAGCAEAAARGATK